MRVEYSQGADGWDVREGMTTAPSMFEDVFVQIFFFASKPTEQNNEGCRLALLYLRIL
jgi:hypothetical protein